MEAERYGLDNYEEEKSETMEFHIQVSLWKLFLCLFCYSFFIVWISKILFCVDGVGVYQVIVLWAATIVG